MDSQLDFFVGFLGGVGGGGFAFKRVRCGIKWFWREMKEMWDFGEVDLRESENQ